VREGRRRPPRGGVGHERSSTAPAPVRHRHAQGKRPDLEAVSGQEKRPVLVLPGGEAIAGSKEIIGRAKAQARG
jgi:hypothetical protein